MGVKRFFSRLLGQDKETKPVLPGQPGTEGKSSGDGSPLSNDKVPRPDAVTVDEGTDSLEEVQTEKLPGDFDDHRLDPDVARLESEALKKEHAATLEELETLRKGHVATLEELETLRRGNAVTLEELETLRKGHAATLEELEVLRKEYAALHEELEPLHKEHAELEQLRQDYAASTEKLDSLQKKYDKVKKEKDNLSKQMDETVARNKAIENTLVAEREGMEALQAEIQEIRCESKEKDRVLKGVSDLYNALESKFKNLGKIIDCLKEENRKLSEQYELSRQREWSRKSEKFIYEDTEDTDEIPEEEVVEEYIEIVDEDGNLVRIPKENAETKESKGKTSKKAKSDPESGKSKTGRKGGYHGRKKEFFDLPVKHRYDVDFLALDEQYGVGNYTIKDWSDSYNLVYVRAYFYREVVHKPIIQVRETMEMVRIANANPILPRSIISGPLFAGIVEWRFANAVTFYRLEKEFERMGCPITRNQMAGWVVFFADYFKPIYEQLACDLRELPVNCVDETTVQVLRDGRDPGTKSYPWVHCSSPFVEGPKIMLYCFEKTRRAEHLLEFYDGYEGIVVSDCYQAYALLARQSENEESTIKVTSAYCNDHFRRPFAKALNLVNSSGMDENLVKETLEYDVIKNFAQLYHAYDPLVEVSPEERLAGCQKKVKPIADRLFEVLESLDVEAMCKPEETDYENLLDENGKLKKADPNARHEVVWKDGKNPTGKKLYLGVYPMSDTLRKAIAYGTNPEHKKGLRLFLSNPMVPISNSVALCELFLSIILCEEIIGKMLRIYY